MSSASTPAFPDGTSLEAHLAGLLKNSDKNTGNSEEVVDAYYDVLLAIESCPELLTEKAYSRLLKLDTNLFGRTPLYLNVAQHLLRTDIGRLGRAIVSRVGEAGCRERWIDWLTRSYEHNISKSSSGLPDMFQQNEALRKTLSEILALNAAYVSPSPQRWRYVLPPSWLGAVAAEEVAQLLDTGTGRSGQVGPRNRF